MLSMNCVLSDPINRDLGSIPSVVPSSHGSGIYVIGLKRILKV